MKALLTITAIAAVSAAHAVTFTNVIINSAPLSNGSSFSTSGNSISFFTPNAIIVEGMPVSSSVLSIQYDVTAAQAIASVGANISAVTSGSGIINFSEIAVALDSNGNEIPGIVGSMGNLFTPSGSGIFSGSMSISGSYTRLRIKKSFLMSAPATTAGLDMAALAIANQNVQVVPEPATMTALGLGALALMRRRRSR